MKPDGVARGLIGEIIGRLEAKQLRVVAAELRTIDLATAERHYAEHQGKDYYDKLVEFITQGPSLVTHRRGSRGHVAGGTGSHGRDEREGRRTGNDSR